MKNLKKVKEINVADQFIAIMDMLQALGYETSGLTILDVASIKHDVLKAIDTAETVDLTPFMDE